MLLLKPPDVWKIYKFNFLKYEQEDGGKQPWPGKSFKKYFEYFISSKIKLTLGTKLRRQNDKNDILGPVNGMNVLMF